MPPVEVLHLFREQFPNAVDWASVTHNALRLSMAHFAQARLAKVLAHYYAFTGFPSAMRLVRARGGCARRREIAEGRIRDSEQVRR